MGLDFTKTNTQNEVVFQIPKRKSWWWKIMILLLTVSR